MSKRIDPDIIVLKAAMKALLKSTSRRMLEANIEFLIPCVRDNYKEPPRREPEPRHD